MKEVAELKPVEIYGLGVGTGASVVALIGLLYYVYNRQTKVDNRTPPSAASHWAMYDMDQDYMGGRRRTRKSKSSNRKTKRR